MHEIKMGTPRTSLLRRYDGAAIPLSVVVRVALGAYFIHTGINKLNDPAAFLKAVRLYELLPESPPVFLNVTAIALPWLEVCCGIALVLGMMVRGAALAIALMLCVFTPAILARTIAIMADNGQSFFRVAFDCGCGTGKDIIWIKTLKNIGLFIAATMTLVSRCRAWSLSAFLSRSPEGGDGPATPEQ